MRLQQKNKPGRKMTRSLFRQMFHEDTDDLTNAVGKINYFWKGCGACDRHGEDRWNEPFLFVHVLWKKGGEYRRMVVSAYEDKSLFEAAQKLEQLYLGDFCF